MEVVWLSLVDTCSAAHQDFICSSLHIDEAFKREEKLSRQRHEANNDRLSATDQVPGFSWSIDWE